MIQSRIEYKPVLNALRQAAGQMGDKRPLMRSVAGVMFRAVEDNFEQEGRPKWKDLHPGTKLSRYKQGTWPGKILQRSAGGLAASIVQLFDSNRAVVGSNKVYAAIQNFGGKTKPHVIKAKNGRALSFGGIVVRSVKHPGSNIPAREFLRLTPGDLREIIAVGRLHYAKALARNGLQSR
ncbi:MULTISPECIES: phage virion morphogenesis protein [unclassified Polaromonas]|uniref:phage virion morphogenesis protein n=1 Tax=unclassified Polaromonas TaxID=2638319 RepID=UPI000BC88BD8|nr:MULTISPECIES: phage virion morphogenesis protein [unclassified Polaromonas]OYY34591.1 MAG: phage virion morphogenesis protein [Polaromonas sp. 35-63-35]OYZ15080.1 MAG: phage virion morphogenesis protein [Polaromonas sp. 16-63-31]OYZ78849.1 MAG: phage virion morphogenesis protein [Polaromonas sp. 24-63-21]OZA49637.1 MAG: phage virion morphogenesis protein [Polaromonas sp. 17-63-33]OZA86819.1 MAG: phage virion morphogenesis protein [Polaromonas sp. 39-63-25]